MDFKSVNVDDISLMYKDHKDFFVKMHDLRAKFVVEIAESSFEPKNLRQAFQTIEALVDWTSSYIQKSSIKFNKDKDNITYFDETLEEVSKEIKMNKNNEAKKNLKNLFRNLNSCFENSELLPKINIGVEDENSKFWREEEHAAMKEIKKAFYDVLVVNN